MQHVMKPNRPVGIVGYGAYIPAFRIMSRDISRLWRNEQDLNYLPIEQKSVPGADEDTITMSIEAANNALARARVNPNLIRAIWVGSESHPYAVKPSGTVVAEALEISPHAVSGDFEFACKAGTEAIQAAIGFVGSSMADYALAVGMDTAQGRPGDALEYTAAAGGAAFIIGPAEQAVATIEGSYSYVSDTPDFFRRAYQKFPEHGNRFTGEPAYFHHLRNSVGTLMEEMALKAHDFDYAVFHQPNTKFPVKLAKELGFTRDQIKDGLLVPKIGNTYAGAAVLGLTAILDIAKPGSRILAASFGSGAGSDAFCLSINNQIEEVRTLAPMTTHYVRRSVVIDYGTYARWRTKIIQT
ncbi:MAG: hydroxymethylglutaryl-CoA synthase [Caldithrix sp.]|nr:hydroxymethylglutaryl-CoA synthase [Caldithrix sp.]